MLLYFDASIIYTTHLLRIKSLKSYNSNSSSLCWFRAIWLAGEKGLSFDKFHEPESRNYFPSTGSYEMYYNVDKSTILHVCISTASLIRGDYVQVRVSAVLVEETLWI